MAEVIFRPRRGSGWPRTEDRQLEQAKREARSLLLRKVGGFSRKKGHSNIKRALGAWIASNIKSPSGELLENGRFA